MKHIGLLLILATLVAGIHTAFAQAAERFIDNGDGTITDTQSGLMWEKKTGEVGGQPNAKDVHDVNHRYEWRPLVDFSPLR